MTIRGLQKIFLDQMGNHFGISFGGKAMAFFNELSLQRNVILDNAIVNYDDSSGAVAMRVSVFFSGTPVRGPASVANPIRTVERLEANDLFQIPQLALSPANLQTIAIATHGDPRWIVAA